jgi:NAD-dependent deacetylase
LVATQAVQDIGYKDINLGDEAEKGGQLRPHIVWFGEYPFNVDEAYTAFMNADLILVIGTSLQISYTLSFFQNVPKETQVIYIDPSPMRYLDNYNLNVEYISKKAVEGVCEIVNRLIIQAIGSDKNDK